MDSMTPVTLMSGQPASLPQPSGNGPSYRVRLATTEDLTQIFALRYDVFFGELGAQPQNDDAAHERGLDVDAHDALCDHLVINSHHNVVGTYRLLPLSRLKKEDDVLGAPAHPYSQGEFDVSALREHYGDEGILELGRSCIRNGQTARLLWAGLAQYMTQGNYRALIGCVSVHGLSAIQAHRLALKLGELGVWDSRFNLGVQPEYREDFDANDPDLASISHLPHDATSLMPPLMKGYINMGAKVCGGPAYDASFGCHDFLMLLDAADVPERQMRALLALSRR
jgi:putative hemolysin